MRLIFLIFLFYGLTSFAQEKITTIAVIDTGYGYNLASQQTDKLCQHGHIDFTKSEKYVNVKGIAVPKDDHSHGTNVAGIIIDTLNNYKKPYCLVIIKIYDFTVKDEDLALERSILAINHATEIGVDYINYSGGGKSSSWQEARAVRSYIDNGGKFIAAAGNEYSDLAEVPYYPAMSDSRVIVIGNHGKNKIKMTSSNYGNRVNRWEVGENATAFGLIMSGTSQATAVATGKIILEKEKVMIVNKKVKKTVVLRK